MKAARFRPLSGIWRAQRESAHGGHGSWSTFPSLPILVPCLIVKASTEHLQRPRPSVQALSNPPKLPLLVHDLVSGEHILVHEIAHDKEDRLREEFHTVLGGKVEVIWAGILKHGLEMRGRSA